MLIALRGYAHAASVFPFGDTLHYSDARMGLAAGDIAREVAAFLVAAGFDDAGVEPIEPGIEDTFMALMGPADAAA
jgi:hypothetical protein